jgi:hypothetical protein
MLQWFQPGCQNFHEETNYNDIHMGVIFFLFKMFHVKQ